MLKPEIFREMIPGTRSIPDPRFSGLFRQYPIWNTYIGNSYT